MKISTETKLFKLRSILNQISDASFAFKSLYHKYPLPTIKDDAQALELIEAYEQIIGRVISSINTEYENQNSKDKNMD